MRPHLRFLAATAALVLPLSAAACGNAADAGAPGAAASLKWASSSFPTHWDPVVSGSGAQFRSLALVYASLTRTDANGKPVPDLASGWDYNKTGDRITFHLRPGLKFSDGTPVDAAAVKAAIERAKTQKNSALFGDLTSIKTVDTSGLDVVVHLTQTDYQIPLLFGERVLQTGVYNFADVAPSQAKAAKAAGLDVFVQPGFNASNISLNVNKAPFTDPKVVDAVRYATNRQEFVDKLTFGYGHATGQPFPPGYVAYDTRSADLYPYDRAKAKQLLSEAGFQPGQIKLDLVIPAATPAAEIVQSQLAAVGITVNIKIDKNWATPFFAKQLAFSLYGTTGRDSAAQTLTAHFGPNGPLNLSTPYEPAGFEAAIAKVRQTPLDDPAYTQVLQAATRAGLQSKALVFTYEAPNLFAKSKSISALPGNAGHLDWTGVTIGAR